MTAKQGGREGANKNEPVFSDRESERERERKKKRKTDVRERKEREQLADLRDARYHLIGHLQSNKAKKAAELFQVIQTVDSGKLARRLNESAQPIEVMLEVKLSPEEAKSGAAPADLPDLIAAVRACPNLRLLGLMTMPPWSDDPEAARGYFRRLRELAEAARAGAAFHGHVARPGDRHRRRLHLRARGNRAVRQAEEAVTVGFYSPLPPARTGVADYAAALLAELRRHGRVEVAPAPLRCGALSSGQ